LGERYPHSRGGHKSEEVFEGFHGDVNFTIICIKINLTISK
jgi:hypothetical protein